MTEGGGSPIHVCDDCGRAWPVTFLADDSRDAYEQLRDVLTANREAVENGLHNGSAMTAANLGWERIVRAAGLTSIEGAA